ncbi:hypothetical protein D3C85_1498540 [compost metagenome]
MRDAALRIVRGGTPYSIHMDHPAIAEAGKGLVDAERNQLALFLGATGIVIALVQPGGHERAVLANNYAVVNDSSVNQQIGKPSILGSMLLELQFLVYRHKTLDKDQHKKNAEGSD